MVCEFTRSPCFWEQQEFLCRLLLSNSRLGAPQYKRFTPVLYLQAFLQLHMLLYCLLGTPFSALLWYHSTWSSLLSSLDWPFHLRPVRIAELLPIFHHRLNNTFYTMNENISPPFTAIADRESPFDPSLAVIPFIFCFLPFALTLVLYGERNIVRALNPGRMLLFHPLFEWLLIVLLHMNQLLYLAVSQHINSPSPYELNKLSCVSLWWAKQHVLIKVLLNGWRG